MKLEKSGNAKSYVGWRWRCSGCDALWSISEADIEERAGLVRTFKLSANIELLYPRRYVLFGKLKHQTLKILARCAACGEQRAVPLEPAVKDGGKLKDETIYEWHGTGDLRMIDDSIGRN